MKLLTIGFAIIFTLVAASFSVGYILTEPEPDYVGKPVNDSLKPLVEYLRNADAPTTEAAHLEIAIKHLEARIAGKPIRAPQHIGEGMEGDTGFVYARYREKYFAEQHSR